MNLLDETFRVLARSTFAGTAPQVHRCDVGTPLRRPSSRDHLVESEPARLELALLDP
jgi:hypothetical protein